MVGVIVAEDRVLIAVADAKILAKVVARGIVQTAVGDHHAKEAVEQDVQLHVKALAIQLVWELALQVVIIVVRQLVWDVLARAWVLVQVHVCMGVMHHVQPLAWD